jgi:hypothetical protein
MGIIEKGAKAALVFGMSPAGTTVHAVGGIEQS